ncbi:MAG: zinc metalloprotease HtpX [Geminicoccaceae bacterium]|nr:zinc metalloprotease HtpX [Geminicoccaceae bacterium]MCB9944105.1 zinc metalloprotease HtpX [Geminicoccaceae bacterium]
MGLVRTGVLLAAMTALFLAIGYVLGGEGGMMMALLGAMAMNGFAFWGSADMVLRMHNAREVDRRSAPDFYGLVEQLARNAGLPMPRVFIIDSPQPNAFATGRSPSHAAVAATTGILRTLTREELAGVMAHELAHVQHRDTLLMTVAATIAGAIGFLAQFAFFFRGSSDGERTNPIAALLIMILAPIAASIVQMAISRTREFAADRRGAEICGNSRWLAGALQKIEAAAGHQPMPSVERHPATAHMFIINPLMPGGLSGLFRSHPPTAERISRLMAMAQAPRNTPPAPRGGVRASSSASSAPKASPWPVGRPAKPRARRSSVPSSGRGKR